MMVHYDPVCTIMAQPVTQLDVHHGGGEVQRSARITGW